MSEESRMQDEASDVVRFESPILFFDFISGIINVINTVISIIEKLLFIVLGLKALNQGTVKVPVIDSLLDKYMD